MSARLEAAVKAWDHYWGDRYGDEAIDEMGEEVQVALKAADDVMFSEAMHSKVAQVLWESEGCTWQVQASKVFEALKGEAA